MKNILISGGTGLIGQALSPMLRQAGYTVSHLSRRQNLDAEYPAYRWDIDKGQIDEAALLNADAIIHLAGAGIADKRWSAARKKEILDSRVMGTKLLAQELQRLGKKPEVFVASSAIGYYGDTGTAEINEQSPVGTGFMADVCKQWEEAAAPIRSLGIRMPVLRIGIVLTPEGGALAKMLPSYRFRLGAYFGNGQQYYAWIHLEDICRSLIFLMENPDADGIFNGTAPSPITNKALAQAIATARNQTALVMPAPAFALRLALGEMADMILQGTKVLPTRLQAAGFQFKYPTISDALGELLGSGK